MTEQDKECQTEDEYARYRYFEKFLEIKDMLGCKASTWAGHNHTYAN